ncbi:MAG: DNA-directed RNA polymerase subunit omega [Deltaproteobacteria bacterium CG_4_10_14_0_2_um_filter_43_8]|nr:MAG: DNA-directed RNA polymerase subunit omega [Deltaproteobacteria bacterium CG11_big_fil_rev_8_21_14_0_20_42_23]PJA21543.1 MAG: DNA-directed RNA polymerase subunit omega [Deltaproteobacteria bacterium CG_4_10_14_0_2_um_filter_43_8]PJC63975.1 MAG: DNA-directed RNA polymerase subunit omega [Deltaproteobacteria bacterium CG_4_9_14_0_2_um_filter_42_21]
MARVTIEDCLDVVDNRFALVHATAERTKQLFQGSKPLVNCKNREAVTALREIADNKLDIKYVTRGEDTYEMAAGFDGDEKTIEI